MSVFETIAGSVLLVVLVAGGIFATGLMSLYRRKAEATSAQPSHTTATSQKENTDERTD